MRRACLVTLKFVTASKRHEIGLLCEAYRGCVNRFIEALWALPEQDFGLDAETLNLVPACRLSQRYKSQCLKQAIEIVISTRRASVVTGRRSHKARRPRFTGNLVLDAKFVTVEDKGTCPGKPFDLVVRLSTLKKGKRITILTNRSRPLNKWLSRPGARFVQGCSLSENQLILWVQEPEQGMSWAPDKDAVTFSGDLGMRKLLTVKDDRNRTAFLGCEYHALQRRIGRCKPESNHRKKLLRERDHVIGRTLNALPWGHFDVFGVEDLRGITRGKKGFAAKGKCGAKEFRRQSLPWAHRQMLERLSAKAAENRVLVIAVDPRGTSRECPNTVAGQPCRCASALNRKGEQFRCVACGHSEDADGVGAGNIRSRTLATLQGRRRWLSNHPGAFNRTHFATRRRVASLRLQKVN